MYMIKFTLRFDSSPSTPSPSTNRCPTRSLNMDKSQTRQAKHPLESIFLTENDALAEHGNRFDGQECSVNEKLQLKETNPRRKTLHGLKHWKFPEIDEAVLNYIWEMQNNGGCVSYKIIQVKEQEVMHEKDIHQKTFRHIVAGSLEQIEKTDQMSIFFHMPCNSTIGTKGVKFVSSTNQRKQLWCTNNVLRCVHC
ncbi:hypothetical protein PR048_002469 [Dryococelus australis]|uniref:Uncharacterized protein n=1 Tax=Dryococelus australis TaxID=614101 RepID=A0ABQ9IK94_9NEOP|nr:hypothetical protein PR048_002469 [Dryococelus australis]